MTDDPKLLLKIGTANILRTDTIVHKLPDLRHVSALPNEAGDVLKAVLNPGADLQMSWIWKRTS